MFSVIPVTGMPEVRAGDDLAALILEATGVSADAAGSSAETALKDGDILVVTSKIVSKAEGRMREDADRERAIDEETVRLVAAKEHPGGVTRIVENRQGLVMAAAGVDASNTPEGTVLLLPADPDASARALCAALRERTGLTLGVILSDTVGRPWRLGQTDLAIGAAGVRVLDDLRGMTDAHGRALAVTALAVADELASAAELVKGKAAQVPVAIVRGLALTGELDLPGARSLQRDSAGDLFRLGSTEAYLAGYADAVAGLPAAPAAASAAPAGEPAP